MDGQESAYICLFLCNWITPRQEGPKVHYSGLRAKTAHSDIKFLRRTMCWSMAIKGVCVVSPLPADPRQLNYDSTNPQSVLCLSTGNEHNHRHNLLRDG
jgi:hypothetical protein